jgi:hypothetical protein
MLKKYIVLLLSTILSCSSYALVDPSLINNSNPEVQVLLAKELGKKLSFTKAGYSFVFGWEGNHFIENFEKDARLYNLSGTGNTALLTLSDLKYYHLDFQARYDDELEKGMYKNARRYPFNGKSHPGLDFSGNGSGCNQVSGKFKILEIEKNDNGEIIKFASDFEHHCEMSPTASIGSIRFNSSLPTTSSPAILSQGTLVVPLTKIEGNVSEKPSYVSMVLHAVSPEVYRLDSIISAENSDDEEIKVPAGNDYDLNQFVIPSVIEVFSTGELKEYELHLQKLPKKLMVGAEMKVIQLTQIR